jgi:phenylalanyl-tRNA synthetase beta chain
VKISFAWLREIVAWPGTVEALAAELTLRGLPVDGIEKPREDLTPIVVGEVLEARRHPNADRLTLCRVRVGDSEADVLSIVCGASNVRPGIRVAVGRVGTTLPNGLTLAARAIRGETSHGMICSGEELACDPTPEGIWVLPDDAPVGASLRAVLGLDDAILDIDVPSNRGDCLSHIGVAREVAAWSGEPLALPDAYCEAEAEIAVAGAGAAPRADAGGVPLAIEDPAGCPVYGAARLRGVRVGPSPAWLRRRLGALGVRSITNVVDATNLVLLESGHPIHAFDLARLRGPEVRVRRARPGERIVTLDDKEHALAPQTLVIADAERAVALAGIMGGKDSEVAAGTTEVLLEVAVFDAAAVRAASRALRKTSEASLRFGRGVDPEGVPGVLERAARLVLEVAGGERVGAVGVARAAAPARAAIAFAPDAARRLLGVEIADDEVESILGRIGCRVARAAGGRSGGEATAPWSVTPPSHRRDLAEPVDLAEEVGRLHGYDRIPESERAVTRGAARSERARTESRLRGVLAGLGFFEARTLSLVDPGDLARLRLAPADDAARARAVVGLENPLSVEQSALRPTVLAGLLACLRLNRNRGAADVRLFEVGTVFRPGAGALDESPAAVAERPSLGLLWWGSRRAPAWDAPAEPADFFDLKGVVESLAESLRVPPLGAAPPAAPHPLCHPGRQATLSAAGKRVGFLGEVDRAVADAADLPDRVLVAEIDLDALFAAAAPTPRHEAPGRFPAIRRDVALVVDEATAEERVRSVVERAAGALLETLALFDVYRGDPVPAGKKSLAYALVLRSGDATLTDAEADAVRDRVVAEAATALGAAAR